MRFIILNAIALSSLAAVAILWSHPLAVLIVLGVLSVAALMVERSKHTLILYVLGAILGSLAEATAVYFGAWTYATPQIIGVPFWLAPLWGLAGIYVATVSEFLRRVL